MYLSRVGEIRTGPVSLNSEGTSVVMYIFYSGEPGRRVPNGDGDPGFIAIPLP